MGKLLTKVSALIVMQWQAVLKVERQVIGWFEILKEGCFRKETFPVGIADGPVGEFYWFPEFELPGMKIGKFYHLKEKAEEPSKLRRTITAADEQVRAVPYDLSAQLLAIITLKSTRIVGSFLRVFGTDLLATGTPAVKSKFMNKFLSRP